MVGNLKDLKIPQTSSPNVKSPPLTRIVPWSQQLACEVLRPGDLAVDLTAGKGRDTLCLAKAVGPGGRVVAFDVQQVALQQAAAFLKEQGLETTFWSADQAVPDSPGIYLVQACHSRLEDIVRQPVQAIIANLGYLPGGDQALITQPDSTLSALQQSLRLLDAGGRLAVTVYPSHQGGTEEATVVDVFFVNLPRDAWQVLSLRAANRSEAPYLWVAERI